MEAAEHMSDNRLLIIDDEAAFMLESEMEAEVVAGLACRLGFEGDFPALDGGGPFEGGDPGGGDGFEPDGG